MHSIAAVISLVAYASRRHALKKKIIKKEGRGKIKQLFQLLGDIRRALSFDLPSASLLITSILIKLKKKFLIKALEDPEVPSGVIRSSHLFERDSLSASDRDAFSIINFFFLSVALSEKLIRPSSEEVFAMWIKKKRQECRRLSYGAPAFFRLSFPVYINFYLEEIQIYTKHTDGIQQASLVSTCHAEISFPFPSIPFFPPFSSFCGDHSANFQHSLRELGVTVLLSRAFYLFIRLGRTKQAGEF